MTYSILLTSSLYCPKICKQIHHHQIPLILTNNYLPILLSFQIWICLTLTIRSNSSGISSSIGLIT